jgi:predicted dehydrogenase
MLPKSDLVSLEVDVIADLMIEHVNGCVSQIHLDMIQRPAHRQGVVSCERGWVAYDLITQTINSAAETQTFPEDCMNQSYFDEMKTFLDFVSQGKVRHEHDAWRATQSLAIVDAAFEAAETGGVCNIAEWVINLK